jgi:hypothetical protein
MTRRESLAAAFNAAAAAALVGAAHLKAVKVWEVGLAQRNPTLSAGKPLIVWLRYR